MEVDYQSHRINVFQNLDWFAVRPSKGDPKAMAKLVSPGLKHYCSTPQQQ